MVYDKVYLIGTGRVAGDCLKVLKNNNVLVQYVEIFDEGYAANKVLCERLGIPYAHVEDAKNFLLGIEEKALIISAHNSYIFPEEVCAKDNLTIINLHIAYLPMYRGMNPTTWAIYNLEEYGGVTWHLVTKKIDAGKIIVQSKVPIGEDDSAMKLMMNCFFEGVKLLESHIGEIVEGKYNLTEISNDGTRLYLKKELPNDGYYDFAWGFKKAYAFLRSMDYRGSNIMRFPRVVIDDRTYEITSYKKCTEIDSDMAEGFAFENECLTFKWNDGMIECKTRPLAE